MNEKLKAKILNLLKVPLLDGKCHEAENIPILENGAVVGRAVCWAGLGADEAEIICDIVITDPAFGNRLSREQINLDDISLGVKYITSHHKPVEVIIGATSADWIKKAAEDVDKVYDEWLFEMSMDESVPDSDERIPIVTAIIEKYRPREKKL